MASDRWVALLRGINVGGRNRLAMADLRRTFEAAGRRDVRTYIQSGNVLFESDEPSESALAAAISSDIEREHGLAVPVIVRRLDDIARIAGRHPDLGGDVPKKWLHVYVLDRSAEPARMPDTERIAPDRMSVDGREIYATYPTGSGRSKLTIDLIERAFGVTATARNLSTLDAIVVLGG